MNQLQRHEDNPQQPRSGMVWVLFLARSLAATVEVFLHDVGTFGERYLGPQAAAGLVLIFVFPAFSKGDDPTPMLVLLCTYVFMCVGVRAGIVKRRRLGGPQPHSFYSGRPHLMRLFGRRVGEAKIKAVAEPILVWLAGVFLMPVSESLGSYLLLAGFGLVISINVTLHSERQRALDMHDAFMEQRELAERFRKMRGE